MDLVRTSVVAVLTAKSVTNCTFPKASGAADPPASGLYCPLALFRSLFGLLLDLLHQLCCGTRSRCILTPWTDATVFDRAYGTVLPKGLRTDPFTQVLGCAVAAGLGTGVLLAHLCTRDHTTGFADVIDAVAQAHLAGLRTWMRGREETTDGRNWTV